MEGIDEFLQGFRNNRVCYEAARKRPESLFRDALQDVKFLWESRVEEADSLERKLHSRLAEYKDEAANIDDIQDLVRGRMVLARSDYGSVERMMEKNFTIKGRNQHPKEAMGLGKRFRGYAALHFHVTRPDMLDTRQKRIIIEIQVMTGFMWSFATLEHDIEYKELHGEPSESLRNQLDMLRGIANLGELGMEQFETMFSPGFAGLHSEQQNMPAISQQSLVKSAVEIAKHLSSIYTN